MSLRVLAALCCVVPLVAAHAAYLVSANQGLVPWCVPYLDGCTSISRAARHGLANVLFQALMLPVALVMARLWWRTGAWLRALYPAARRARALPLVGIAGAAFLALYVANLGATGEWQAWLRRYGVTFYFAFTVVAQMLAASLLAGEPRLPAALRRTMAAFCAALLALGLASIPLQHLAADADAALDAVEWWYALLMTLFFPLVAAAHARAGAPGH